MAEWTVIGLVVGACAALWVICLWLGRRGRQTEGPACGRCGYDVRGLPSSICPECGSDLRVVGIIRPGSGRWLRVGLLILCWSVTVLVAMNIGLRYGPAYWGYRWENATYQLVPKSKAYAGVSIFYDGYGFGRPVPVETVKCIIDPPNRISVVLEVYRRGLGYSCPDEKWRQVRKESGFDESVVVMCLRTGAVDTSSRDVQTEAAELCRIIRGILDGSQRAVVSASFPAGHGSRTTRMTSAWLSYVFMGLCAVVWGAGCWWIGRRHLRRREWRGAEAGQGERASDY